MVFIFSDSGSIMVFAEHAWQAVAGVMTLAFVTHFLSPVEQGSSIYWRVLPRCIWRLRRNLDDWRLLCW